MSSSKAGTSTDTPSPQDTTTTSSSRIELLADECSARFTKLERNIKPSPFRYEDQVPSHEVEGEAEEFADQRTGRHASKLSETDTKDLLVQLRNNSTIISEMLRKWFWQSTETNAALLYNTWARVDEEITSLKKI